MAVHIITESMVDSGVQVTLADNDKLFVAEGVTVGRTDATNWSDFTISGNGNTQIVDIHGAVVGDGLAINIGDSSSDGNSIVTIHETGLLRSYRSDSGGVRMEGSGLTLENAGHIISTGDSVVMDAHDEGTVSTIVNDGTIRSTAGAGISIFTAALGEVELHNTGRIIGTESAYKNSPGTPVVDRVYNDGIMKGSVVLGAGDDLYDGRKGVVQDGIIDGGIGDDVLCGGKGAETLLGGGDADRLYGGAGKDTFAFNWLGDSTGKERDLIADFSRKQGDRIDLSMLDDNAGLKLDFIGDDKFSKSGDEVRFQQMMGGVTQVQVDQDGDGKADLVVDVKGHIDFVASDFLL